MFQPGDEAFAGPKLNGTVVGKVPGFTNSFQIVRAHE